MITVIFVLLFVVLIIVMAVIDNRNNIAFEREQAKEIRDIFNIDLILEKGEPNVLYIDYTNDEINENFIGYLKNNLIVYTVDLIEQNGEKYYKVIYKELEDYGKKWIEYKVNGYPFADDLLPNIYTELPKNITIQQLQDYGEKIAKSFFYTNEYLKYRNNKYDTVIIEYKDITAYVVKELERYTNTEYCSNDYMNEVYVVRKYVIKHFQKLLEENTEYYATIEIGGDYTVLMIKDK